MAGEKCIETKMVKLDQSACDPILYSTLSHMIGWSVVIHLGNRKKIIVSFVLSSVLLAISFI